MADLLKSIGITGPIGPGKSGDHAEKTSTPASGPSFRDALGSMDKAKAGGEAADNSAAAAIKFSNHAIERMRMRGISYSPEQMSRIETAVGKAQAKGARETLLLTDDSAMIVNVNNKTVVTVMDKNSLKENVFTNIDSTVVI